jgi:uncharacterized protein (DUF1778 family)
MSVSTFNPAPVEASTRIEVRVPLDLRGRIAQAAEAEKRSVSDFIRGACEAQLASLAKRVP